MVNISKQTEDSILFEFQNSQHYLYGNGEISVPLNSLQLVIDNSDMVTFKKLDGDPFVSFNIDESNFASKDALVEFYETEMVGGGGIPTEEIQEMIDESIAPIKAETVTDAEYISSAHTINLYNISGTVLSSIDATDFLTDGMLDSATVEDVVISGETQKCLVLVFNTDAGKDNINIPISELFDPSLVQCDEKIIEGCELIRKETYTIRLNEGGAFVIDEIDAYDAPEDIEKTIYFKLNFDIVQNDAILLGIIGGEYSIKPYTNMCSDGNYLRDKGWYTLTNGDYKNSAFVLLSIEDGQITNVSTVKSTFDEGDLTVINHGDYVEIKKWLRTGFNVNYNNVLDVGVAFLASGETPSFNSEDCGVKWLNVPYDGISDDDLVNCIKFFNVYKIYPAESASERIDRIEDEIISKASAYTVNGVDDNGWSSGGVLYINQRNLNILGDECTIHTPFMKYDMNTIGYEDGKGLYSTMWILDIDKINEQTPTASISGGEVMQISSLQNAIFEFELSQSTCGEIHGELMSPSIEFGRFSVYLNANRFNFMASSFDEETGEESWTEFEGKIVRKGNTVALEFNLDSPITDLEIEFHASGWNCDEEPELIEAKYYEDLDLEWSHIKLDEKLATYDTAIDAINNEIDEKEEVISRTFYQLEDEISGLTDALSGKQDTLIAGSGITISGNVISAEGGSITIDPSLDSGSTNAVANSAITEAINEKAQKTDAFGSYAFGENSGQPYLRYRNVASSNIGNEIYYPKINNKGILTTNKTWAENNLNFSLVETSAITSSITSASTETEIPSAKAVYDAIGEGGGGLDEDFLQANANALYELKQEGKATNERFDNYYTKTASDGKYASNASIKKAYYDKAYVDDKLLAISASLNELNDDKQDALVAGDGISISGNVISANGGGGAEYSAGTNISIDSANTISCTLPISANGESIIQGDSRNEATGFRSHAEGYLTSAKGRESHAEGYNTTSEENQSHAEGESTIAKGPCSHAEGYYTITNSNYSHAEGYYTITKNVSEHASGFYNVSNTGSTDADNTLFSVGNGTAANARHNAFEIRKNGDIYYSDGTNDVKLQDVIKDLNDRIAALELQLNNN